VKTCIFHPDQVCTLEDTATLEVVETSDFTLKSPSYGNVQALKVKYPKDTMVSTNKCAASTACLNGNDPGILQNVYVQPNRRYVFEVTGHKGTAGDDVYLYVRDISHVESQYFQTIPLDERRTDVHWTPDPEQFCDEHGCTLPGRDIVCKESHCIGTTYLPHSAALTSTGNSEETQEWQPVSVSFLTGNSTTRLQVGVKMDASGGSLTNDQYFWLRSANLRLHQRDFNLVSNPSFETPGLDKTGARCQMPVYPKDCVTMGTTASTTTKTAVDWTLTDGNSGLASNDLGRPGQSTGYQSAVTSASPVGDQVLYLTGAATASQTITSFVPGRHYQISWLENGNAKLKVKLGGTDCTRETKAASVNCDTLDCRLEEDIPSDFANR